MKFLTKRLKGGAGRTITGQAVNYATRSYVGENKKVDVRFGMSLLRDRRVAIQTKLIALGIGIAAIAALEMMEFPLEMLIAALMPVVGLGLNFLVDGMEFIVGPALIAAAALPYLAPKSLVDRLRSEMYPAPVYIEATNRR